MKKFMNMGHCKEHLYKIWQSGSSSYAILLAIILMVFVIPMTAVKWQFIAMGAELAAVILLVIGIFTVPCGLFVRSLAFIAIVLSIVLRIVRFFVHQEILPISEIVLEIVLLLVFSYLMVRQFLSVKNLISHRIAGAVAVYLLIGILFARCYQFVFLVDPETFRIDHYEGFHTLVYFSFVTLVTIGYGDVVPLSLIPRNLSILEGVIGQLYVVILISSLVSENVAGAFIDHNSKNHE